MSRLSRPEYHPYSQQTHPRWSPSPPLNRASGAIDPRVAPRMAPQDMQPPLPAQIPSGPVAATSHAELVQAVNAMSAQVSGQLSMVGSQLSSLVSLTSRLIELSQLSLTAADNNARGRTPLNANNAPDFNQVNRPDGNHAPRPNGLPDSGSLASANPTRSDARTGLYSLPGNYYRGAVDPMTSSLGAMRGASPSSPPSFASNVPAALNNRQVMQQQQPNQAQSGHQTHDHENIHKSRLPSPVFPDDPLDLSADVSTSSQQNTSKRQSAVGAPDSARKASAEASLGDWKVWLNRNWQPPPGHNPRAIHYRTMQSARRAHRDHTNRSMATLGRLPLKEYLEIKPDQYLNVRKTGRKLYQEWLLQEVRLAKQPEDRVKAAINKLETDHSELGDCEDHWKSRQLLQQIIDNAIDEANLSRKKEARSSNSHHTASDTIARNSAMDTSRAAAAPPAATAQRAAKGSDSNAAKRAGPALGTAAGAGKGPKTGSRRKADQADLDTTPTRFRQPPSQRNSIMTGIDVPASTSMQAQHSSLSSTGMDGRSLTDYSSQYNENGALDSTTGAEISRQHSQQSHHPQHQPQHQQDHAQNAWANPNANAASTLFGQSNYVNSAPQTLSHHQHQPPHSQNQQYQSHGGHNAQYMSSAPSGGVAGQGGLGPPNSALMEDQQSRSMVNSGNVRMQPPGGASFFDYRHHQP